MPQTGDRVLLLKENWLALILAGSKSMEVRGTKTSPGGTWLASGSFIRAWAHIETVEEATRPIQKEP